MPRYISDIGISRITTAGELFVEDVLVIKSWQQFHDTFVWWSATLTLHKHVGYLFLKYIVFQVVCVA